MELDDLLGTPISKLSVEELEKQLRELKKLKMVDPKTSSKTSKASKKVGAAPKSNKDKQVLNAFKKLDPEQAKKMMEMLGKL